MPKAPPLPTRAVSSLPALAGRGKCIWVNLNVWTFFCTVRVDQRWDDSKDLVEIARGKFNRPVNCPM